MRHMILLSTISIMIFVPGTVVAQGQCPYLEVTYEATTDTFYPSDDASIGQHEPGSNYGAAHWMMTRNYDGEGSWPDDWAAHVLVKFDISSISPGTVIDSAELNLYYYYWDDNNPSGNSLDLFRITSNWNEDTVTWNNRPSHITPETDTATVPGSPGVWMQWDVTADVQSYLSGTENHGWKLIDMTNWGQFNIPRTWFRTKEYLCGNGVIELTEACDDGGTAPGDGCDTGCQIEAGWDCVGEPSVCTEVCGDGMIVGSEECDDSGTTPGDGCDATCQVEPGWSCTGEPSECDLCGNGGIGGAEECDDGGTTPGDGCDATCQIEHGWECSGEPSVCVEVCGNGLISTSEQCDDAGTTPGDGCDASCQVEPGWECVGEPSVCSFCGDGVIEGTEGCDDGGTTPGDGCDASCQVEEGWSCAGEPSECDLCGNGGIGGTEECDDGGTTPGDGCDASCQVEPGWECVGEPSVCSFCGDGVIEGTEGCDDGGTTPGDGCDASCQIESGWRCFGEPSVCILALAGGPHYPITGSVRFQIGDGLPIPIGFSPAPAGKIYARPGAVITQASRGPDPRRITIPNAMFKHPGTPPVVLPLFSPIFQVLTEINVTIPTTPMRPGDALLNVLQENGRTGQPTVTWCPGQPLPNVTYAPNCTAAGAGPITNIPGILRYRKTENQFGGPLSAQLGGLVDIALRVTGAPPPCSFVTTTCQAVFAIGPPLKTLAIGEPFGRWTKTTGLPPSPGEFNIIVAAGGTIVYITPTGLGPGISNPASSWGGPWTTGQIINTVLIPVPPFSEMFTRTGSDNRVNGVGTLSLIAGAVSNRGTSGPNANRGWLNITVPEPAAVVSAASALLLVLGCHRLVRRRSR